MKEQVLSPENVLFLKASLGCMTEMSAWDIFQRGNFGLSLGELGWTHQNDHALLVDMIVFLRKLDFRKFGDMRGKFNYLASLQVIRGVNES